MKKIDENELVIKEEIKFLKEALKANDASAQYALGMRYLIGYGVKKNIKKSVKLLLEAAANGHEVAQIAMGAYYSDGLYVTPDIEESNKWYKLAAEQGSAYAQWCVGVNYYDAQRYAEAAEWFSKATEQNYPAAIYYLACCYKNGLGVTKNLTIAYNLFCKAASLGDYLSQRYLEKYYRWCLTKKQ
jgi:TPR repeat protein